MKNTMIRTKLSEVKKILVEEVSIHDVKEMLDGVGNRLRTIAMEMRRASPPRYYDDQSIKESSTRVNTIKNK